MGYQYILFDLDGTITDSAPGIYNSVRYALQKMNIEVDEGGLRKFVGPPLINSFRDFYGMSQEQAEMGVRLYREYYSQKGLFENEVYTGIPELLKTLHSYGKTVLLATSKPETFAKQILTYFGLDMYFAFCGGSTMDNTRSAKADVIQYVLREQNILNLKDAVMIGDREHDVLGAKACGLDCIGVLYGYGNREELKQAGVKKIVETAEELLEILI